MSGMGNATRTRKPSGIGSCSLRQRASRRNPKRTGSGHSGPDDAAAASSPLRSHRHPDRRSTDRLMSSLVMSYRSDSGKSQKVISHEIWPQVRNRLRNSGSGLRRLAGPQQPGLRERLSRMGLNQRPDTTCRIEPVTDLCAARIWSSDTTL